MNRFHRQSPLPSALLLAAIFFLASCAAPPVKPPSLLRDDYAYVREYISWLARGEMKKHEVMGLSIALVDGQRGYRGPGPRHQAASPRL